MAFHFIHTGDWHLAKRFGRFDGEKAPLLRAQRASIVDRVGDLARRTGAGTVLVAGDVFDGPMVGDTVLRKLAAQLEQFADMTWHFLPGNHDPATANGVWQRFESMAPGAHAVIHTQARTCDLEGGTDLLVAPLRTRAIAHDPTEWMTEHASVPGVIRVGLAHGAIQGFGSGEGQGGLISPDRAITAGLDYLALGDWHGVRQAGPKAWYAGTPEAEQFPDNEPGYALEVRIARAGAEPEVERHWLGGYRWQRHVLDGHVLAALGDIEREIAKVPAEAGRLVLRFDVRGRVSLENEIVLRERIERLGDRTFHTEADFSQMTVDTDGLSAGTFSDPLLAAVAARLADKAAQGPDEAQIAHQALLLLAQFSRAGGEAR